MVGGGWAVLVGEDGVVALGWVGVVLVALGEVGVACNATQEHRLMTEQDIPKPAEG